MYLRHHTHKTVYSYTLSWQYNVSSGNFLSRKSVFMALP